ncbi:MAG: hypothetical protein ACOC2F_03095 [Bacteroidota bacterium]
MICLVKSWARLKRFQKKDSPDTRDEDDDKGDPTVDFHGESQVRQISHDHYLCESCLESERF